MKHTQKKNINSISNKANMPTVKVKYSIGLTLLLIFSLQLNAQKDRKLTFVGGARSILNNGRLIVNDSIPDTTTVKRNEGGYALIDLGVNIKPNKNTEIMGMFRIKNNFGGFWGSGVSFDVRQLWIKGIVGNVLRYQLGDLNLKQSKFTLYNHHADQIDSLPAIFNLQQNIVNYERFYMNNNTWRMQGANIDFGLTFSKFLKEINFTAFLTRLNATNFANVSDRLMNAYSVQLVKNNHLALTGHTNTIFDVNGTTNNKNLFNNSVNSIEWKYENKLKTDNAYSFAGEFGNSHYYYSADTLAPRLSDYFIHAFAQMKLKKMNLMATVGYLNVGADFRSIGAQSKDVNYNAQPVYFNRYTNTQVIRPTTLFDVISNENIYSRTINSNFMSGSQLFNNVLPYGLATFNRVGAYLKLNYKNKKELMANAEYYNLSEIRGQGTTALKQFAIYKVNVNVPFHKLFNLKRTLSIQAATNIQMANRKGNEPIENVDLKMMQTTVGLRWEFSRDFELIGGMINQTNKGNDFSADRNAYTEVTYFQLNNYNLTQQITAVGLRYNFTPKIYLCALYQQSNYQDKKQNNANFKMNQFGLIYNIIL